MPMNSNEKRCECGKTFSSSDGRTVCMDCFCGRYNRQPGTPQADAVDRPGAPVSPLRPLSGGEAPYHARRRYAVRLAEGFAMLGGAG